MVAADQASGRDQGLVAELGVKFARLVAAEVAGRGVAEFAAELASAFPKTGIWPLLWRFDEEPDAYLGGHGDLEAIDGIDVEDVLSCLRFRSGL